MPDFASDDSFARAVEEAGVTPEQIRSARVVQAESVKKGKPLSLGEVLVQQAILTAAMRENIEKKLLARQAGSLEQLGNYRLLKKLGEGGMGAVYLAQDTVLDRKVALKILPPKSTEHPEFLARFRREARAAGKLNHPNIVSAYAVDEEAGRHYYVMEYCEGESLDKTLKRQGSLPWRQAVEIVTQIARGLQHAHLLGFIHRDIKPGNILLTPDGTAKILDLGLSKSAAPTEQSFQTVSGAALGTPHYISPEQARGEGNVDGRTDIYSLGATFYHLITGRTPFQGSTAAVVMTQHLNAPLPSPQEFNPHIPDGVAQVVIKMMARNPRERYADCKELLDHLARIANGKRPAAPPVKAGEPSVVTARLAPGARAAGTANVTPIARASRAAGARGRTTASPVSLYLAVGLGVLALLILSVVLLSPSGQDQGDGRKNVQGARGNDVVDTRKSPGPQANAEAQRKEDETRSKSEPNAETRAKPPDVEREKAEETRKASEAALQAAEEERKRSAEARKPEPPVAGSGGSSPVASIVRPEAGPAPASAEAAERLFAAVLKELEPLLAQNKLTEATALLKRKLGDPALAEAAGLLKQELADIASIQELRRQAVEALRKQVGNKVTLRRAAGPITGKVKDVPDRAGVTLDLGGPEWSLDSDQLHVEDIDAQAPALADPVEDARRRGYLFLAAVTASKAREYFVKARDAGLGEKATPYLQRVGALEAREAETSAAAAWDRAEKLFAAKNMKAAREAYEAFERVHAKTQTMAQQAAQLKERLAAIQTALGQLVLDLGGGVKMEFVLVKAGEFEMGTRDGDRVEKPLHKIKISKPYYLGKYEVTQAQYEKVMGNNPSAFKGPDLPVEMTSWDDAQVFCKALRGLTGRTARLPTEAEWEYACRAGSTTRFCAGDKDSDLDQVAWFKGNSGGHHHPVGQKQPNAWGFCDMHGNVWEWVQDYFGDSYYAGSPPVDPKGPGGGEDLVLRGGCAEYDPGACRSASRLNGRHAQRMGIIGFRVALDPPPDSVTPPPPKTSAVP